MADSFSKSGAEVLARKIARYWKRRGQFPKVWVEQIPGDMEGDPVFQIRSNMVGGKPA